MRKRIIFGVTGCAHRDADDVDAFVSAQTNGNKLSDLALQLTDYEGADAIKVLWREQRHIGYVKQTDVSHVLNKCGRNNFLGDGTIVALDNAILHAFYKRQDRLTFFCVEATINVSA